MPTPTAPRLLSTAALLLPLGSAIAQEPDPVGADTWRFQITPYVWMTGLQGDIRPSAGLPTVHISQPFSDVIKHLDAAAFLSGTARKGRYVLHGDTTYASVSDSATLPGNLKGRAKVTQQSMTLLGGYNWDISPIDSLDLMAGVRWWNLHANVQVQPIVQAQINRSFADPIAAVRWRRQWNPDWSTLLYADAGGLGVGSQSTWQVVAVANYQLRSNVFLSAGFRHISVDYRNAGTRLNVGMGGPLLGATFRF